MNLNLSQLVMLGPLLTAVASSVSLLFSDKSKRRASSLSSMKAVSSSVTSDATSIRSRINSSFFLLRSFFLEPAKEFLAYTSFVLDAAIFSIYHTADD